MSDMEIFYGVYEKSDIKATDDGDNYFETLAEEHGCHFVDVDGQLYSFYALEEVEPYGFSLAIEPSDQHRFICYWYNGGGGIHEMLADLIRNQQSS